MASNNAVANMRADILPWVDMMMERHPNFTVTFRGHSQAAVTGLLCRPTTGAAKAFLTKCGMQASFGISLRNRGDHGMYYVDAMILAREWCLRMQFYYDYDTLYASAEVPLVFPPRLAEHFYVEAPDVEARVNGPPGVTGLRYPARLAEVRNIRPH